MTKIMRHPGGPVAAARAATARSEPAEVAAPAIQASRQDGGSGDGTDPAAEEMDVAGAATATAAGDSEGQDGFVGMTLADYMGRPTEEAGSGITNGGGNEGARPGGGAGGGRPGVAGGGARGGGGGGPPSVAGSTASGRVELSSAASGRGGRVVRLAPAHIAPPSRPAPEWVVDMQVGVRQRTDFHATIITPRETCREWAVLEVCCPQLLQLVPRASYTTTVPRTTLMLSVFAVLFPRPMVACAQAEGSRRSSAAQGGYQPPFPVLGGC